MNTKVVKSFGLALIVAVGVLALLLATGTFSPQKAGAQATTDVLEGSIGIDSATARARCCGAGQSDSTVHGPRGKFR